MERSTVVGSSQGAFFRFCEEVNAGRHPEVSKFGHDFCHDFVLPPLDRSPRSLGSLLAIMGRYDACPEAIEGASDAWRHFEFERAMR